MFLNDLYENVETMDTLVVYPGRFQPWHRGHHEVYNYLVKNFGRDRVFIATSNKVEPPRSPFSFAEKVQFMHFTGIPNDVIVEARDPYKAVELTSKYNPKTTRLIFAVSQKDMDEDPRFTFGYKKDGSPTYLQDMPKNAYQMQSLESHAYIMVVPTFPFKILGKDVEGATDIRRMFSEGDEQTQQQIIIDLFGRYSPDIHALMKNKITLNESMQSDKSQDMLMRIKKQIDQNRAATAAQRQAELAQWEQDFKQNMASRYRTVRQPELTQTPTQIAAPIEKHSVLQTRMANLNKAIEKTNILNALISKAEQRGLMTPGLRADTDISLYVSNAAQDNYVGLNQKLDKSIELVKQAWNAKKLAYSKPKSNMREQELDEGLGDYFNKLKSFVLKVLGKKVSKTPQDAAAFQRMMSKITAPVDTAQYGRLWQEYKSNSQYNVPIPRPEDLDNPQVMYLWSNSIVQFVMNKFPDTPVDVLKQTVIGLSMFAVNEYRAKYRNNDISEENDSYRPPGASRSQTAAVMNKMHPAEKFVWKRPNQIGGSFSEQELLAKGFKKSQYNSWGGTPTMWRNLLGVKETVLNQPTPTLRDLIKKYPNVPLEKLRHELQIGVRVEYEHTKNARTATEIALDHLNERPDYYTVLAKVGL